MVDVNQRLDLLGNIRQAAELEHLDLVGTKNRCWPMT